MLLVFSLFVFESTIITVIEGLSSKYRTAFLIASLVNITI